MLTFNKTFHEYSNCKLDKLQPFLGRWNHDHFPRLPFYTPEPNFLPSQEEESPEIPAVLIALMMGTSQDFLDWRMHGAKWLQTISYYIGTYYYN